MSILTRLQTVTQLTSQQSLNGQTLTGRATVRVTQSTLNRLIFDEHGELHLANGKVIPSTNRYEWHLSSDNAERDNTECNHNGTMCLSLSHLRHAVPVHLVNFHLPKDTVDLINETADSPAATNHNRSSNPIYPICLRAESPHLCGADSYDATLLIDAQSLHLQWRITGAKKDISIDVHYV